MNKLIEGEYIYFMSKFERYIRKGDDEKNTWLCDTERQNTGLLIKST